MVVPCRRVRRALNYAVDKGAIIEYGWLWEGLTSPLPSNAFGMTRILSHIL